MNIAACVVSVRMVVSAVVATSVNRVVGGFVVSCVVVATSVVVYCVVGASWVVGITSTKAEP